MEDAKKLLEVAAKTIEEREKANLVKKVQEVWERYRESIPPSLTKEDVERFHEQSARLCLLLQDRSQKRLKKKKKTRGPHTASHGRSLFGEKTTGTSREEEEDEEKKPKDEEGGRLPVDGSLSGALFESRQGVLHGQEQTSRERKEEEEEEKMAREEGQEEAERRQRGTKAEEAKKRQVAKSLRELETALRTQANLLKRLYENSISEIKDLQKQAGLQARALYHSLHKALWDHGALKPYAKRPSKNQQRVTVRSTALFFSCLCRHFTYIEYADLRGYADRGCCSLFLEELPRVPSQVVEFSSLRVR